MGTSDRILKKLKHIISFISVINQLDAYNLFYNKFISRLYMFRAYVLETCRGMK